MKHEGLVLSNTGEEKKNSNKKGGGCAILEASCRHFIREEEISFELIPRPLMMRQSRWMWKTPSAWRVWSPV